MRVKTLDGDAQAIADYIEVDEHITFEIGDHKKYATIRVLDHEGWEPDEDFFVQLYQAHTDI